MRPSASAGICPVGCEVHCAVLCLIRQPCASTSRQVRSVPLSGSFALRPPPAVPDSGTELIAWPLSWLFAPPQIVGGRLIAMSRDSLAMIRRPPLYEHCWMPRPRHRSLSSRSKRCTKGAQDLADAHGLQGHATDGAEQNPWSQRSARTPTDLADANSPT